MSDDDSSDSSAEVKLIKSRTKAKKSIPVRIPLRQQFTFSARHFLIFSIQLSDDEEVKSSIKKAPSTSKSLKRKRKRPAESDSVCFSVILWYSIPLRFL